MPRQGRVIRVRGRIQGNEVRSDFLACFRWRDRKKYVYVYIASDREKERRE